MLGTKQMGDVGEREAAARVLKASDEQRAGGQDHEEDWQTGGTERARSSDAPHHERKGAPRGAPFPIADRDDMRPYCLAFTSTPTMESQLAVMNALAAAC